MSRANFAAAFKAHVGVSPGDYLTGLRVRVAKKALLSGERLKSVAARAGYSSTTAFARVFQRRVGCNPRDFVRMGQCAGASHAAETD
jgi:AraC-like DNA-binding protein